MKLGVNARLAPLLVGLVLGSAAPTPAAPAVTLTNQLATAASPYLRGAAKQPVAWYPWGDEAFRLAKALDRPILLDIGAVWCHWCHVMDEETYGDAEVARLINAHFVAIKVDRDERPDIDARYQRTVQALVGQGGWPLTVFLTPAGHAFHGGGTFFPDDRFGRPSFKKLLPAIAEAYRERRDRVVALAGRLQRFLAEAHASSLRTAALSPGLVKNVAQALARFFDPVHGGFGQGPKFPAGASLDLALRLYAEDGDQHMLRIATVTLDHMARGGVRDHLGGGFHRYAVDREWRVPHFEKLDYDNAQLLLNYLGAYQATQEERYRKVAEGIIGYVDRVMSDRQRGGFYAHQDADMGPGDDGGYYTWTLEEVRAALPKDEAEVIARYYGIEKIGDMRDAPGRNVLAVARAPEDIARELKLPDNRVMALIRSGTRRLLDARSRRTTPYVDRTIFADRNGMMTSAYFEAYKVLGREDTKAFGLKSLDELAYLTNVQTYRQRAEQLLTAFAGGVSDSGRFVATYGLAVDLHLRPPAHAVIIGSVSDPRTRALWGAALAAFRPGKIVAAYDPGRVKLADLPPPVAAAMKNSQAAGAPQAFVCVATACSLPTSDPSVAGALVTDFERHSTKSQ